MKKILITGTSSYIGNAIESRLSLEVENYKVDKMSMRKEGWKEKNFSEYDSIFHVAGIVHKKETEENRESYYKINRDLTHEVAKKAKADGAGQFIFLSSMSVYGLESGEIDKETAPEPQSNYGKSKYQAEKLIEDLRDDKFKVSIMRPPMVYGRGCKGNYPRLANFALKSPIFPDVENRRSMIYIENLSEFVKTLIDDCSDGLFFPQNDEYVRTSEMVRLIAKAHGKGITMTKVFNPLLRLFSSGTFSKVFGDLVYDKDMSRYNKKYCVVGFEDSIEETEREM